jgi:hypothetical protein
MSNSVYFRTPIINSLKTVCKEYAMSLGIDNSPVKRKATAEELAEFADVKPYKGWTEADTYRARTFAERQAGYYSREKVVNPKSSIAKLKADGKIYVDNRA